ncbi:MAG: hypothetical protein GVY24_06795 [Planctomycetes bacterium]|jgi:type II secretory pathway pseudopilin PulG|nr:hypothetical protein [Planctomycetota bacterium]
MTLVELLLAVAITTLIGAAIASMLAAVSYGTDSSKDMRSLVARNKAVNARISAAIRGSTMVLDQGAGFLVLWTSDADENGQPNLLEIRRLQYNANGQTFSSYTAPEGTGDVEYALADNFEAITDGLMGGAAFPQELWATRVAAWDLALDTPDPQTASLVSYQLELTAGDMSDVAIAAVALRN